VSTVTSSTLSTLKPLKRSSSPPMTSLVGKLDCGDCDADAAVKVKYVFMRFLVPLTNKVNLKRPEAVVLVVCDPSMNELRAT